MTAYIVHSLPLLMSAVQVTITLRFYSATHGYSYPWVQLPMGVDILSVTTPCCCYLWVESSTGVPTLVASLV